MKRIGLLLALAIAPEWVFADYCTYSRDHDFAVDAASLETLSMDVGSGSLEVIGNSGSNEVRVIAKACASSSRRLEQIDLTHRVHDSQLFVSTEFERNRSIFGWLNFGNSYGYIDIEVQMPSDLSLEVDDGSGSMEISGITALSIDDGSGSILIHNIGGDVSIEDGSGAITIRDVRGKVSVSDGSGPIEIRESGDVEIIDDGSGNIEIEHIHRNVNVYDDGSGSIRIHDVAGDVKIGDPGSGSVNVSAVAGTFDSNE
jgi:hypothetical protein